MTLELAPLPIEIAEGALDDLRERLSRTRWPNQVEGIGWEQGTELGYLQGLCEHWRTTYDWRACEARLAAYEHVAADIDGQRLHALVARSPEPDALPLLLVHGWPGSVVEFLDVLGPLTDPRAHGGNPSQAFHVVCPSLPGFGYSGPTTQPGWHPRRIAEACGELMTALGFERFGAQGGDWGSIVTANVADLLPERVVGLHLNFVTVSPPKDRSPLSASDEAALARIAEFRRDGSGYQEIQGTRPQSLGYGHADPPAALAAWIVEKFRSWSDNDGDVEQSFPRNRLLDNLSLYWLTGTGASAGRIYWEMRQVGRAGIPQQFVRVPTGIANFPGEVTRMPRHWVEGRYNVVHWTDQIQGGHFAAMEVPGLFVDDVRAFFSLVR